MRVAADPQSARASVPAAPRGAAPRNREAARTSIDVSARTSFDPGCSMLGGHRIRAGETGQASCLARMCMGCYERAAMREGSHSTGSIGPFLRRHGLVLAATAGAAAHHLLYVHAAAANIAYQDTLALAPMLEKFYAGTFSAADLWTPYVGVHRAPAGLLILLANARF